MHRLCYLLPFLILLPGKASPQQNFYDCYKITRQKFNEGKYDEALKISLDALTKAEQSGNSTYIAYANMKVGNMHYFLKDKKSAIKRYMVGIGIIEKEHLDTLKAEIYHNISAMYNELQNMDSTIKYSDKAIKILKENKKYADLSQALAVLSAIYSDTKNYDKAENLINQAEYYSKLAGDENMFAFAVMKRGHLLSSQNKYKEAVEQMNTAGTIYRKYKHVDNLMFYYRMQSVYHFKLNDGKALRYNDSFMKLKDSVFKIETAKRSAEYMTLYQTEKKERENKLLLQENMLKQTQIDSRNRLIMGLLIGVFLIAALVAWRISAFNLRKKQKELNATKALQKEKERIARDLHDNVGGQLSFVLYSLDGLNEEDKHTRTQVSETINTSVKAVISNLRETIWAINDESVSVNDVSDKLKVYARNMFRNTQVNIIYNEKIENNLVLNSFAGLNTYRICQEIINNVFKHAKATEICISVTATEQVEITIADNGIGFETNRNFNDSYGLNNIRKRAEESGITLSFQSELNKGTQFSLLV